MVVNRFLLLFGPNFNFSFECWSVYCNLDINCLFVFHVTLPPINIKVVKSHFTPLNPNFNQFVLYEYGRKNMIILKWFVNGFRHICSLLCNNVASKSESKRAAALQTPVSFCFLLLNAIEHKRPFSQILLPFWSIGPKNVRTGS